MARIQAVLDEAMAYGFRGGGGYSVNVTDLENRFEERDENWKYPKHQYDASFENMQDDAKGEIIETFHACRGRLHSFLMRDWNDYKIRSQPIQVLPGTAGKVQLYKRYEFGPAYTIRVIQSIDTRDEDGLGNAVFSPVIIDENGDPVAGSFDPWTGEFTPVGAWGAGEYLLSCDFLVWVRFDDDDNDMTINNWQDHTADVSLIEDPFEFFATNVPPSWNGG